MTWKGLVYVDITLPFGLCSTSKIFTAIADAAEWIVRQQGVEFILYYLDDFLVVSAAEKCRGEFTLHILLETFEQLASWWHGTN